MKQLTGILPCIALALMLPACSNMKQKEAEQTLPAPAEQTQPATEQAKKVIIITDGEHFKKELAEHKNLIAKFHAGWCPHCVGSVAFVEELANKYDTIRFVQIDFDANKDIVAEYSVEGFPTFIVFKDGKIAEKIIGANQPKLTEVAEKISKEAA